MMVLRRRGWVSKPLLAFGLSLGVLLLLVFLALSLRPDVGNEPSVQVVRVYCASGVAKPIEKLIERYNRDFGAKVELVRTGGSGELAGQIQAEFEASVENGADLYVTADEFLLDKACDQGIVAERFRLAKQQPVIAVANDRAIAIDGMQDLVDGSNGYRFGIASKRAAVGKMARSIAQRYGLSDELEQNKKTDAENVMTLGQALVAGSLDAAIIWDTTVAQINQAAGKDVLRIASHADAEGKSESRIGVGVMSSTRVPTSCLKFARYLTAPETGREVLQEFGFTFLPGDRWEERPEIHLYCGSMFTPVLEEAVSEFAQREGVSIYPRWEGCGKLVASMHAIEDGDLFPDGYLACDVQFLDEVEEHFWPPTAVSRNQIVIAVWAPLASSVTGPTDLLSEDLKVGICDPDQSALGRLTKDLLSERPFEGLYAKLEAKSAVTVDVGPTLVSQLLAGGLDAALVYRSNVMASEDSLDKLVMVEVSEQKDLGLARQPWAVSRTTRNPQLMNRLFRWIHRPEILNRFQRFGFELE